MDITKTGTAANGWYDAVSGSLNMRMTHPKHLSAGAYTRAGAFTGPAGQSIIGLEKITGAGAVTRAGTFEEAMLLALDRVSSEDKFAGDLAQRAITEPDTVDIHDLTIAQAKAGMSLDITRNILSRLVQGWRDIINTR
ncbi:MAG: flagellar hook-basal body complex protein FliE [Treponema sp.]|jgi:flagellar hook-basal body complex protein FliE|nr:flagellar hook-basal body complex protein FliE [Treponema sp.]